MAIESRLASLGIALPKPFDYPNPNRTGCVRVDRLLFCSGHPPAPAHGKFPSGKVGADVSEAEGYQYARSAALMILSSARRMLGSLDHVKRIVKVTGMVNVAPGFQRAFAVVDGASDLFFQVWGDSHGCHARSAVGVAELPRGFPVEVEAVLELHAGKAE
ncbi:MAG: RidA family protein [Alphaproteobacteria bacterium]|nr:RidA family protein [Alphaproteobacteria bacterium]